MLYPIILHFLAGAVTGLVFKVRTLLLLLLIIMAEAAFLVFVLGSIAGAWALADLIAVQAGYFGGIYGRSVFEHAGYALPSGRTRHLP